MYIISAMPCTIRGKLFKRVGIFERMFLIVDESTVLVDERFYGGLYAIAGRLSATAARWTISAAEGELAV
jgi:hypothetical protein